MFGTQARERQGYGDVDAEDGGDQGEGDVRLVHATQCGDGRVKTA